ncbi:hypothetical protein [Actibacterium sp. D379-3]
MASQYPPQSKDAPNHEARPEPCAKVPDARPDPKPKPVVITDYASI